MSETQRDPRPEPAAWQEADSALFIDAGKVMIPRRDEIERVLLALIPAGPEDAFTAVDVAAGGGWLSRAILERFPRARVLLLDGSERMLAEAGQALAAEAGRVELRQFRLEDEGWVDALPPARAILSSLALHHLDDASKRRLFGRLLPRLEPGGALLVADLVQPAGQPARQLAAALWYEEVRRQSLEQHGSSEVYDFFVREQWNIFEHPDPMDMPSALADQLAWLAEAGYQGADVFWAWAGHAVYGAYRPS